MFGCYNEMCLVKLINEGGKLKMDNVIQTLKTINTLTPVYDVIGGIGLNIEAVNRRKSNTRDGACQK